MSSWKAQVTEKKTFLEVHFDGEDGLLQDMRRTRSEPALINVFGGFGMSKSRVMFDQFSDNVPSKADTDVKDNGSEYSEQASTMEPLDNKSVSESDGSRSLLQNFDHWEHASTVEALDSKPISECGYASSRLKLESVRNEGCSLSECDPDDYLSIQAYNAQTWVSEPTPASNAKMRKSRPCKGQRDRYRKTLRRCLMQIEQNPELNIHDVDLPPSLSTDSTRRMNFEAKLQAYKEHVYREREIDALLKPLIQRQYEIGCGARIDEFLAFQPCD